MGMCRGLEGGIAGEVSHGQIMKGFEYQFREFELFPGSHRVYLDPETHPFILQIRTLRQNNLMTHLTIAV